MLGGFVMKFTYLSIYSKEFRTLNTLNMPDLLRKKPLID
jgi:hypothetical protein